MSGTTPPLDNAVARSEHSADFDVAPYAERAGVAPGSFAKACCECEWFWLRVVSNDASGYLGTIDGNLLCTHRHGLQLGDLEAFDADQVFDIYGLDMEEAE